MPIKKSDDMSNEADGAYDNIKTRLLNILKRFDDATDNDNPYDDGLQYLNKKVDECIDLINTNETKTGITNGQATAITANTAKTGITSGQATKITSNETSVGLNKNDIVRLRSEMDALSNQTRQLMAFTLEPETNILRITCTNKETDETLVYRMTPNAEE